MAVEDGRVGTDSGRHLPEGRPISRLPLGVARGLRKRMTPQEAKLWVALRKLRPAGLHFRRQVAIGSYVVDFACLKHHLILEVDGSQHARDHEAEADRRRDAALMAQGFRIRRYWNPEIERNLRSVMDDVFAHLDPNVPTRPPAAATLPGGEGERPRIMTSTRLSNAQLDRLPEAVGRPAYDRAAIRTGIVHLGIGAFHRAHMAVYTDDVLAAGDTAWGIVGASLRSPETRDALGPQDGLYALDIRDGSGETLRVVGAIRGVLVAPEDPAALLDAMSAPDTRIVSLTVTEKGYCHAPATGELDEAHPDIVHDLAHPERPRSAPGFVVEALARRREAGLPPFTVMSCDNLPSNGHTAGRVMARLAALRDPAFGAWVAEQVAFPSTMVDRIVPATTDADRARVAERLGCEDRWPVIAEPFTQWVIEDRFVAGRPDWPGATFVRDVEPFELMKLRLLNGSHSTLAYLGYLAGHETVADAMSEPAIAGLVAELMDIEVTPTLPPLAGFDLAAYKAQLLARFRNPALRHRTWQIAMDGSQKLPQRLLATIRDRLADDGSIRRLVLGVAAWMRYAAGTDEAGRPIDVRDPLAASFAAISEAAGGDPARLADGFLRLDQVFGGDLPADPRFAGPVREALALLFEVGAVEAARRWP